MQHDFPYNIRAKNEFYGGCSNNNFDFETLAAPKVHNSRNKDPIVKLGSFGHNSLKYYAYSSTPWPCTIIPVRVMDNCPRPNIILLHICNLRSIVFAWSTLSWILHRNSSFDHTNFILQVWYKFLHDSWCMICFLNFASYSRASLLFFPNLDIVLQGFTNNAFGKHSPRFHTLTFKWCLFFNLLITYWEIFPMFNSLLIYQPTKTKTKQKC
jgi:hypothetical protein